MRLALGLNKFTTNTVALCAVSHDMFLTEGWQLHCKKKSNIATSTKG